jgi:hypothetical protein
MELLDRQVQPVLLDRQDRQDRQELPVLLDQQALQGQPEQREHKGFKASLVLKGLLVLLVLLVLMGRRVLKGLPVQQVQTAAPPPTPVNFQHINSEVSKWHKTSNPSFQKHRPSSGLPQHW